MSAVHTEVMNLSGVIYMDTADREYDQLTLVRVSWSYLGLTLVYNTGSKYLGLTLVYNTGSFS